MIFLIKYTALLTLVSEQERNDNQFIVWVLWPPSDQAGCCLPTLEAPPLPRGQQHVPLVKSASLHSLAASLEELGKHGHCTLFVLALIISPAHHIPAT